MIYFAAWRFNKVSFCGRIPAELALFLALVFLPVSTAFSQAETAQPVDGVVSFPVEDNMLAAENGTEAVEPSDGLSVDRLIDGNARAGWRSDGVFVAGQPLEITLRLPSVTPLASLLIQPQSAAPGVVSPYELELLTAGDGRSPAFEPIGLFHLRDGPGWQLIEFGTVNTRFLKIRVHSVHREGPVGIGEVAAFGPGMGPGTPFYRPTDEESPGFEDLRVELLSVEINKRLEGVNATPGYLLVAATLEITNDLPRLPLTIRLADYLVLLEDGHYVYELHPETARYAPALDELNEYLPGVSVSGRVLFEVPENSGYLELAYLLPLRPTRFELTPAIQRPPEPNIQAVSNSDGELITYLYEVERMGQTRGLKLDIGLRLNTPDSSLVWQINPADDILLVDRQGRSYPVGDGMKLRRPFGQAVIRYGVVSRGEIEFPNAPVSDEYALTLPFESGYVTTLLPPPPPAHLARTRKPYEQPDVVSPQAVRSPIQKTVIPEQTPNQSESETRPTSPKPTPPKPAPAEPLGPQPIKGIPDVLNTGLLSIRGRLIPLYGVEGVYEPHVSSFTAYIRDREVDCTPEGDESYRCTLEGADLSKVVLGNGAARAKPGAPAHLKAAESEAKSEAKGIWQ